MLRFGGQDVQELRRLNDLFHGLVLQVFEALQACSA
jgi:hypothetical protein